MRVCVYVCIHICTVCVIPTSTLLYYLCAWISTDPVLFLLQNYRLSFLMHVRRLDPSLKKSNIG